MQSTKISHAVGNSSPPWHQKVIKAYKVIEFIHRFLLVVAWVKLWFPGKFTRGYSYHAFFCTLRLLQLIWKREPRSTLTNGKWIKVPPSKEPRNTLRQEIMDESPSISHYGGTFIHFYGVIECPGRTDPDHSSSVTHVLDSGNTMNSGSSITCELFDGYFVGSMTVNHGSLMWQSWYHHLFCCKML